MLNGLTMDFNALDLLASAAVLQTRDSDTTGGTECTTQGGSGSSESTEQGADNDEDPNSSILDTKACIDLNETEPNMGSMKKGKHPHPTSVGDFPKQVINSDLDELINEKVENTINQDVTMDIVKSDLVDCTNMKSISEKVDNSDTDSCVEEDIEEQVEVSTSNLVELPSIDVEDSPGKNKTIMRSLLTGQTVCDDVDDSTDNLHSDNCDEKNGPVSVLGNDSAIGLYVNDKTDMDVKMDKEYSNLNSSKSVGDYSIIDCDKDNTTSLHDSALESSQSASDQSSSLGDTESLHFLVVSDHCYATVPGKTSNLRCSYLGDEPESDSGIDGNSSSEEAEHRTRSISLESNCLQCSFPEVSGRSGQLLSQGSSDLERSPTGNSGFSLGGLTVLSPTLSSSDSQCSDYHNNSTTGNLDTVCDGTRKYKTVDFEVDNSLSSTTSDPPPEHNLKVGKFRIGKFASFTNIDTDQEKIYGRDAFSPEYGVSSSSTALPSSPGIPSLLQSPCGDWDRSDAGSEALDDLESFLTPEPPKELMMVLQGFKPTTAISPPAVQSSVVHHDHDYCFRSGALPPSPVTSKKSIKSEKRKYMTAARSRGTPASLKESKRSKTLKIKNNIGTKGPLSETIEKVKNSLATTPVPIDCNFKKPEQPVNSLLLDKLNPLNRQKRVKSLEIKEELVDDGEVEIDAGSKLKITGKFQNDFVYFLNKTSRNRRRSSVETSLPLDSKKSLQPAKPIDIIIPHLTDDDLEVLQTKGRAGLARLEKFSSNPNLLDRFSATLQIPKNGTPTVISGDRIKNERNNGGVDDDDKIINTILSMENDNLGSPVTVDNHEMDFFGDGETINLMGENMTLTKDQVDLLLNAVKHVSTPEDFTGNEKVDLGSTDCDHSSTCSTEILDPNTSDVANPEWTINNNTPKLDKQDTDTESTYSSSDVGPSSCVSDIKEDSQESFELRSDIVIQEEQGDVLKNDSDVGMLKVDNDQIVNIKTELDIKREVKDDIVIPNILRNIKTEAEIKVEKDVSDLVDNVVNVDSNLVDKSLNRSITNATDNKILSVDEMVKPMLIDNELEHIDISDTKPDKSLLDAELNGFPNSLAPSLSDLSLPLEKSFELLGGEFRLDKPDELFPEANVETSMPEPTESDYNDTPWVVTVTVFWNDLPAIMINNRPYIRLVDIHKQILPAKDTGILKKRCQLLSIHVVNCTEMQRYFLVQYGRGYNSKSTLIVGKVDACQLVGYYAQPQPRLPRSEDGVLNNLSRLSQHMAMIRGKQSRFNKRKRSGSKTASRNTSPERKDGVKSCVIPTSPKPRKQPPPPPIVQPELTKRLRHKKINFLEMLKGDSQDKVEVEDTAEKKVTPQPVVPKKKVENVKKTNNRTPQNNKRKEIEIVVTPDDVSSEEEEEESEDLSETESEDEIEDLSEGDIESESDETEDSETVEEVIISKKKGVKSNSNNIKQSPKKSPRSPNDKSPNTKGRLGPLRVNVQGLLNFPKSVKKSAINDKTGCKSLDVVHIPLEFHDGMIPISQSGKVFLDLYKKKSSLCVKCADCDKLLSISSFLQHQHYPEESKTLTTVLDTQTLSLKSSEMSRNIKQLWEEFQKRYEKFEGCRFLKPVVKAVISPHNSDKLSNFKSVIVRENYPQQRNPLVIENIPVPNLNINLECETDIVHVNENLPQTILDNSELTEVGGMENKSETLQLNHCHIDKCDVDKKSEISANNKMLNIEKSDETIAVMEGLNCNQPVKLQDTTIQSCKKSGTVKSSGSEVKTTPKNNNIQTIDSGLDKSGVRSSSRKRKSRQYFSFEDYSFSNKKTKMDESSDCK